MEQSGPPCGPRGRSSCDDAWRSAPRATRVRSWSCDVRALSVEGRAPRAVVSGRFFADEDDSGRRSWEAVVALGGRLEDLDPNRACTVLLELGDGRRVRGRAVVEPEPADAAEGEARYLFVGSEPLTRFDWSLLDGD